MEKWKLAKLILLFIFIIGIVLTVILVPLSISYVYPGEVALLSYGISKYIDTQVYKPGRYFIGLTNKFIKFPESYISLKDNFKIFTSDFQPIEITFEFFYKINAYSITKYNLYNFYFDFGIDWQKYFHGMIINTIKNEACKHSISEYFKNKPELKKVFFEKVNTNLSVNSNKILNLISILIHKVKIPDRLESAIEDKLSQSQKIKIYSINNQIAEINKTTERLEKQMKSEIEIVNLDANSYLEATKMKIHTNCLDNKIKTDADAYGELNDVLLGADGQLINFMSVLEQPEYKSRQFINFQTLTINNHK